MRSFIKEEKLLCCTVMVTLFCASALTGCSNLDNTGTTASSVLLPIQSLQLKVPQNLKLLRILLTIQDGC